MIDVYAWSIFAAAISFLVGLGVGAWGAATAAHSTFTRFLVDSYADICEPCRESICRRLP